MPLLRAPYPCGYGSGCVQVPPLVAALVMFGFDALLIALAAWQLRSGGFFGAPRTARRSGLQWRLGLAMVGAAALAGRFVWPELRQFRWSETQLAWGALNGLLDGSLALTGNDSSINIPNPPGAVYLLAPVVAAFKDGPGGPEAMVALGGAASALTSLLCAWFTRRWTGSARAGLAAGLAFALGLRSVLIGRRVWQQALLPPFTLLFFDALLLLALRRQGRAFVWAAGWLALMVQLHYLAITLAPLLLAAVWLGRRGLDLKRLATGSALAVLLLLPFLLWETSVTTTFRDVRHVLGTAGEPSVVDGASLQFVLDLASAGSVDRQLQPLAGPFSGLTEGQVTLFMQALTNLAGLPMQATGAGALLLLIGLAACGTAAARPASQEVRVVAIFLGAWVLLPPLLLLRHSVNLAHHYFYHLLPAIAVLVGVTLAWPELTGARVPHALARLWRVVGPLLLAIYLAGSALVFALVLLVNAQTRTFNYDEPLGPVAAAGRAAYLAWRDHGDGQPLMVGAQSRERDKMRLALGATVPAIGFDDCLELPVPAGAHGNLIYFLRDETPATVRLRQVQGADLLATIPRPPASAYRVLLVPSAVLGAERFSALAGQAWPDCQERGQPEGDGPE